MATGDRDDLADVARGRGLPGALKSGAQPIAGEGRQGDHDQAQPNHAKLPPSLGRKPFPRAAGKDIGSSHEALFLGHVVSLGGAKPECKSVTWATPSLIGKTRSLIG